MHKKRRESANESVRAALLENLAIFIENFFKMTHVYVVLKLTKPLRIQPTNEDLVVTVLCRISLRLHDARCSVDSGDRVYLGGSICVGDDAATGVLKFWSFA